MHLELGKNTKKTLMKQALNVDITAREPFYGLWKWPCTNKFYKSWCNILL